MKPELWSQSKRDWWTAWRVNLAFRYSAYLTIVGLFAVLFYFLGLHYDPQDPRTTVHLWGACSAFLGGGLLCGTSFGAGTVRAIRKGRKELEAKGELTAEWWSKRSRSYCAKVGFRAAAYQGGRGFDVPRNFRNVWSGGIPLLPEGIEIEAGWIARGLEEPLVMGLPEGWRWLQDGRACEGEYEQNAVEGFNESDTIRKAWLVRAHRFYLRTKGHR